ncbi:reverse transcriptase [Trichonephila clavipes]|uniref:Reverse transcriptase n=1 Tax=Trichonephila clavipes TaxID=2585209 RepID=A0A8X6V578_TRICX|nr:reverse transcriptase [Trichonephila clavipes]
MGNFGPNPEAPGERRGCCPLSLSYPVHDFLGGYLHWLGVAANEAYPLCGHDRMDGDRLLQCTGLNEYLADDIVSRYWEAGRQMVKKPSTGVG